MTKSRIKKGFILFICISSFIVPTISVFTPQPIIQSFAESDEEKVKNGVSSYVNNDKADANDVAGKIFSEDRAKTEANRDTIQYVISRVLTPQYLNNVEKGVLGSGLPNPTYDGKHLCNPDEKQNLLNHNCDVPNMAAELLQTFNSLFSPTGVIGANLTQSSPAFGLGVPSNIPGGVVPVDENQRTSKYTGLELFGYNLKYTSYNGEWDRISTNTEARMLSNFGLVDNLRLIGSTAWNGFNSGISSLITGFDWNPVKWFGNVASSASGSAFNTIVDTSDMNVVATKSWNRSEFNDTLYNVKVLTDKEVITAGADEFMRIWLSLFRDTANSDPVLKKVLSLAPDNIPVFVYDPKKETDASIKARKDAEEENVRRVERNKVRDEKRVERDKVIARNKEKADKRLEIESTGSSEVVPDDEPVDSVENNEPILTIPEPVYKTKEEQFEEYKVEHKDFFALGKTEDLYKDDVKTYEDLLSYWKDKWGTYSKEKFDAKGSYLQQVQVDVSASVLKNNPYLNPREPISHYVCSDDAGIPKKDENGRYIYLYGRYNDSKGNEYVNKGCAIPRASVRGGLFESAWHTPVQPDTRRVVLKGLSFWDMIPFLGNTGQSLSSFFMDISSFVAQITNVVVGLSFSNILESFGVTKMVEVLITSFRDTIFFPLSALAASLGAFMLFLSFAKTRDYRSVFTSLFMGILIFFIGTIVLMRPADTVKLVEEVPTKIDTFIAGVILGESDTTGLCSTTRGNNAAVRSAQCNVWQFMVFNTWVHGQFGTSYSNLYANGKAPEGGNSLKNENSNQVGNAEVKLGGNTTLNNWALYQLKVTKTGTITTNDKTRPAGSIDKNIYKVVDLQVGPNNGQFTDSTYFSSWSGQYGNRVQPSFLGMVQSILGATLLIPLAFKKVELTFFFALSLILLPYMLLRGFSQAGQQKFKEYLSGLLSLFVKRMMAVTILSVSLRIINMIGSQGKISYMDSFLLTVVIIILFKVYQSEILALFDAGAGVVSGNVGQMRDIIKNSTPKYVSNRMRMAKMRAEGKVSGTLGGALAALNVNSKMSKNSMIGSKPTLFKTIVQGAHMGAGRGSEAMEKMEYKKIRRGGFSIGEIVKQSEESVYEKGKDNIVTNKEDFASDTYKQMMSKTKTGHTYRSTSEELTESDELLLSVPSVQKAIRKGVKKRKKIASSTKVTNEIKEILDKKENEVIETITQKEELKESDKNTVNNETKKDDTSSKNKEVSTETVETDKKSSKEEILENNNVENITKEIKKEKEVIHNPRENKESIDITPNKVEKVSQATVKHKEETKINTTNKNHKDETKVKPKKKGELPALSSLVDDSKFIRKIEKEKRKELFIEALRNPLKEKAKKRDALEKNNKQKVIKHTTKELLEDSKKQYDRILNNNNFSDTHKGGDNDKE